MRAPKQDKRMDTNNEIKPHFASTIAADMTMVRSIKKSKDVLVLNIEKKYGYIYVDLLTSNKGLADSYKNARNRQLYL